MATFDCLNLTALKDKYATFRNPGGFVERAVRPRRVVIYGIGEDGKSMATLRCKETRHRQKHVPQTNGKRNPKKIVHQNFKLLEDEASQTVQFIPTNKSRDKRFSMTIFKPPPDRDGQKCFAGIPMHSELLKKYEDENSIDCTDVTLKFKNNQGKAQYHCDMDTTLANLLFQGVNSLPLSFSGCVTTGAMSGTQNAGLFDLLVAFI